MKNLKKILALVLALTTVFGCSVAASAAASDFTDYDEIDNKEAVEVMNTLNVIGGYNTGDFKPDGYLTRAEMCKMVSFVMNGGNAPVLGTTAVTSYSDIKGHWAQDYIEYATSMGIVSGVGGGKFNPNGNLTGTQAAKMMLVAMGYDAKVFGFVGNGWDVNINRYANEAGLYKGLSDLQPNLPITRDQAAQLMYNAILAKTMFLSYTQDMETGEISQTYTQTGASLFSQKFNGVVYEGILEASGYMDPYGNTASGKEKIAIEAHFVNGDPYNNGTPGDVGLKYATDCTDMIGEYVKVLYNSKDKEVYGLYTNEEETTVVVETNRAAMGKIANVTTTPDVKIDGVTYDFTNATEVYAIDYTTTGNWGNNDVDYFNTYNSNDDYVKMVDNDGDGKIDVVFVVESGLETVNYVGTDSMTLTNKNSVKKVDMNLADESYAQGDKVMVTPKNATFNGNYDIAKTEIVEGKVDAVKTADVTNAATDDVISVQVNGNWYDLAISGNATTTNSASAKITVDNNNAPLVRGNTYKLYIRGGVVYAADVAKAGASAVGVITGVTTNEDFDGNLQTRLLKSDGTVVEAYMSYAAPWSTNSLEPGVGQIVAYTVSDDIYTLYPLTNTAGNDNADVKAMAGFDAAVGINTTSNSSSIATSINGTKMEANGGQANTIAGKRINDSAVVFVEYDSNTANGVINSAWKVMTGAEVNSWSSDYGTKGGGLFMNSGMKFLDVAFITNSNVDAQLPGSSSEYAYVTSGVADFGDYIEYTIWTGEGETATVVKEKVSANDTNAYMGAMISFDWDGEDTIKNVQAVSNRGALTDISGDGTQVMISNVPYDLTDDCVIINANTSELDKNDGSKAVVPGNAIVKAEQTGSVNMFYKNVAFATNSDGYIVAMVFDVDGHWNGENTPVAAGNIDADDLNQMFADGATDLEYTGDLSIGASDLTNLTSGNTLTVNGDVTLTGSLTNVQGTLIVNGDLLKTGSETISVSGNLTVTGKVTANLTLTGSANATIGTITTGSGTITNSGTGTVTVTGAVDAAFTAPAGNVVFEGNVTAAVTPATTSVMTFEESVNVTTVLPAASAGDSYFGAKVKFTTAPRAIETSASNAGCFVNSGSTVLDDVADIVLNVTYTLTDESTASTTANVWLKDA